MAGPTDLNPNAEPSVRPYGRPMSPGDFYNASTGTFDYGDRGPYVSPALGNRSLQLIDSGDVMTEGTGAADFVGPTARYEGYLANAGLSRQARIAAASNDVQNAPAMVAQRNAAEARQATMMDEGANAKRQAMEAAADAEVERRVAERLGREADAVDAENRLFSARQEQRALLDGSLGVDPIYAGRPRVAADSPFATSADRGAMNAAKNEGTANGRSTFLDSSKYQRTDYKAPSKGYDIGTIDLVGNEPAPRQQIGSNALLAMSAQAAEGGNPQVAKMYADTAQVFDQIERARMPDEKMAIERVRAELYKNKTEAEIKKINAEIEGMAQDGAIDSGSLKNLGADGLRKYIASTDRVVENNLSDFLNIIGENVIMKMAGDMGDPEAVANAIFEIRGNLMKKMEAENPERFANRRLAFELLNGMEGDATGKPKPKSSPPPNILGEVPRTRRQ